MHARVSAVEDKVCSRVCVCVVLLVHYHYYLLLMGSRVDGEVHGVKKPQKSNLLNNSLLLW